jgi:hypothetical protein
MKKMILKWLGVEKIVTEAIHQHIAEEEKKRRFEEFKNRTSNRSSKKLTR